MQALVDRNVAALQVRALALSGLAAAADDPARATEAGEAFARADRLPRPVQCPLRGPRRPVIRGNDPLLPMRPGIS